MADVNTTTPTIKWYQITDGANSPSFTPITVLNYNAVEAGDYSKIVCVKPHVYGENIGRVRLWWQKLTPTTSTTKMTNWLMKYFVSTDYVSVTILNNGTYDLTNNYVNGIVPSSSAYPVGLKSTWEQMNEESNSRYTMQPIPIAKDDNGGYPKTFLQMKENYDRFLSNKEQFGAEDSNSNCCPKMNPIAYGGESADCNVAKKINGSDRETLEQLSTEDGPFIYFSIKPPSDADAGTWSGFATRMSFLWPYQDSSSDS